MSFLESKVQNIWLITFGDLLTLLLCFFIALITLSGTGYRSFKEAALDLSNKSSMLTKGAQAQSAKLRFESTGTLVAETKAEARPELVEVKDGDATFLELSFKETQLAAPSIAIQKALEEALNPFFLEDSLRVQASDVESCTEQGALREERAWSLAGARALQMRRQLIDLGVAASAIRLRNLGPECSRLGRGLVGTPGKEMVLRMTLKFTTGR